MEYEFYFTFPMPPISILFIILRIFAIFLTVYTLFILVRFLISPESGTDVGRRNEFDKKQYRNLRAEADEKLLKAFKTFNATPNDSYSDISVRYYYLRRMLSLSSLPLEVKEAKLKEIDELFEVITDYYTKR
ncbi:MAG: hypothetical protein WHS64_04795 [Fervidobacterium sp.]|uniref:Uncharacterized protein n=1 Tax=Fervidobacterium gondwanense DSM 13020 TaxID=1121883 RepID=A0A1M7TCC8_FERGO|nr:hypothetical protein [Fervidobacterium gondwanense]UXF01758.1 hypothetical protein IB67_09590 [Fervidobacterium riparium]SHN68331.1 hypothetical protein SAMN02745226_01823 [Fervidobacterium gondwanense DSM 13020]